MDLSLSTQAIESNLFRFCLTVAKLSHRPFYDDGELSRVNCAPSPWPNGILGARIGNANVDDKIKLVIGQMATGMAPRLWMTGPSMQPQDLDQHLLRFGFAKRSEAIGMAVDLSEWPLNSVPPPALEIHTVSDDLSLQSWAKVVTIGLFRRPESEADHFAHVISKATSGCDTTLYLGTVGGQPVASSTLYLSDGIAGIYHVATLPDFRNKGIGRSITLAPLLRAKAMGFRTAILQATQLGQPVYTRLGFVELSRLGRYWLDAAQGAAPK
jgi:ribosomal protein S18 acetylase RimI-like enzyme